MQEIVEFLNAMESTAVSLLKTEAQNEILFPLLFTLINWTQTIYIKCTLLFSLNGYQLF